MNDVKAHIQKQRVLANSLDRLDQKGWELRLGIHDVVQVLKAGQSPLHNGSRSTAGKVQKATYPQRALELYRNVGSDDIVGAIRLVHDEACLLSAE